MLLQNQWAPFKCKGERLWCSYKKVCQRGGGEGGGLEALNMMMSFLNISNSEGPTTIYVFDFVLVLVLVFNVHVFVQAGNKM